MSVSSNTTAGEQLRGARVVVMGLGLHGGGVASARYCAEAGADVTVTDLRDEDALDESIRQLSDLRISFVLGRHEISDFRRADIVVKNPAVPRSVPFLDEARRIETDVSLFLAAFGGPVLAVTGTKGKSSVASALHHVLAASDGRARIGGNITVSPLSFVHELEGDEPVVLELSSFQLGDLLLTPAADSGRGPAFAVSAITNIMPDHQDYYASMGEYAADKAIIFSSQAADNWCVLSQDDEWSRAFRPPHPDRTIRLTSTSPLPPTGGVAGFDGDRGVLRLSEGGHPVVLVEPDTKLPGRHMRTNLLFGGVMAHLYGAPAELVRERTASFGGVPHRLETVEIVRGVRFVNDSAATIAEATSAALDSFSGPVRLIAGGSDKGVPLDAFVRVAASASSLHLLEGTATERIIGLLTKAGLPYEGPYGSLEDAVDAAASAATPGDVVLLSPGCASFGMFRNEFDRGDRFRRLVEERARMVR